jgi:hypothetical protein
LQSHTLAGLLALAHVQLSPHWQFAPHLQSHTLAGLLALAHVQLSPHLQLDPHLQSHVPDAGADTDMLELLRIFNFDLWSELKFVWHMCSRQESILLLLLVVASSTQTHAAIVARSLWENATDGELPQNASSPQQLNYFGGDYGSRKDMSARMDGGRLCADSNATNIFVLLNVVPAAIANGTMGVKMSVADSSLVLVSANRLASVLLTRSGSTFRAGIVPFLHERLDVAQLAELPRLRPDDSIAVVFQWSARNAANVTSLRDSNLRIFLDGNSTAAFDINEFHGPILKEAPADDADMFSVRARPNTRGLCVASMFLANTVMEPQEAFSLLRVAVRVTVAVGATTITTTATALKETAPSSNAAVLGGAIGGTVAVLLLLLLVLLLIFKLRNRHGSRADRPREELNQVQAGAGGASTGAIANRDYVVLPTAGQMATLSPDYGDGKFEI